MENQIIVMNLRLDTLMLRTEEIICYEVCVLSEKRKSELPKEYGKVKIDIYRITFFVRHVSPFQNIAACRSLPIKHIGERIATHGLK